MNQLNIENNSARICAQHGNPIHYINILDNTNKPFSCIRCARDKETKLEELLHFSELLNENNFDFLINFPPLEKPVQQRMSQVSSLSNKNEGILQNIEDYFSNLSAEIEKYISQAKNQAKGKAINLLKSNEEIFKKYNQISCREELRKIIRDQEEDMESRVSQILRNLIKEVDIKKNSKILGECLDKNKIWRESVSFDLPTKIKDTVLNMLSNIDFFSGVSQQQFEDSFKKNQEQQLIIQIQEGNKENSNCSLLMDLIGSKLNFCNSEFLSQTKKMINGLSFYINSFHLPANAHQVERRNVFQKLNEIQINQLLELSSKITIISKEYYSKNIPLEEISETIQPKTSTFLKYQKVLSQQDQKTLKVLLRQFPIIELSSINSFVSGNSILNQVTLIKSQYNGSQQLIISKQLNNEHLVMNNEVNGYHRQSYCDLKLNKQKSYIFRLSVSQTSNNNCNFLMFGLQPDLSIDSNPLYSHYMSYCENTNYGIQKIVKGGQLHKGDGQPVNRLFEIRICLEKKYLRVSEYPNYSSVCEIDDANKIKSDIDYKFVLHSYNKSTIIITSIIEVYYFDDLM